MQSLHDIIEISILNICSYEFGAARHTSTPLIPSSGCRVDNTDIKFIETSRNNDLN